MFLKNSLNLINEFYFIFKNQVRKIYLSSSLYNKKISRVDRNVLVYQPNLKILSSLIKYEKQKRKIEDFNIQSVWKNKKLNFKDYKKLHSFYWLFSIDLKSSNKITQSIIENWITENQNYEELQNKEKELINKLEDLENKISLVKKNDLDFLDMLYREKFRYGTKDEIIIKLK